jgi:hypothetical protein
MDHGVFLKVTSTRSGRMLCCTLLLAGCFAGGGVLQRLVPLEKTEGGHRRIWGAVNEGANGREAGSKAGMRLTVADFLAGQPEDRIFILSQILPNATVADLAVLLEETIKEDGISRGDAAMRLIFTRWVELHAPGMIAALETQPPGWRYHLLQLAVKCQAERDGPGVLEAVWKRWPGVAREAAVEGVHRTPDNVELLLPYMRGDWIESELMGVTSEMPLERRFKLAAAMTAPQIMDDLAEIDPAGVLALAKEAPEGLVRQRAMKAALSRLADNEPEKFRSEYEALPPGKLRNTLTYQYAELMAKDDPEAAVKWAKARPAGEGRFEALFAAGSAVFASGDANRATRLALEAWQSCPGDYSARSQFSGYWPAFEAPNDDLLSLTPPKSFPVTTEPGGISSPLEFLKTTFKAWNEKEPDAVGEWFKTVRDVDLRSELAAVFVRDPQKDLQLIPSSDARFNAALEEATKTSTAGGAIPATNVDENIRTRVPPAMQHAALLAAVEKLGMPGTVWETFPVEDRRFLSGAAIMSKASNDPQAALDFFNQMEPGERSLEAWHEAGNAFIKIDPEAASQWMAALPAGAERDAAVTALVESLTSGPQDGRDGGAAVAWALSMSGNVEREQWSQVAFKAWEREAPASTLKGGPGPVRPLEGETSEEPAEGVKR